MLVLIFGCDVSLPPQTTATAPPPRLIYSARSAGAAARGTGLGFRGDRGLAGAGDANRAGGFILFFRVGSL